MAESNSVDSLPPGWTMRERIRESGKRDKYYYAPSNGPIFNSRVEVSRYLAAKGINRHKSKRKKKRALKKPWKIIAVENISAEDLPSGWIGEILVKERDHVIRRDPYYIEPVSKTVLRSLKAVSRYLETQELATPSQHSHGIDDEKLEEDSTFSTAVIKKGQLLVSRARKQINFDKVSDMNETVRDRQRVPAADIDISAKKTLEDGLTKDESGKSQPRLRKSNKTKVPDLPRRSKRLAGIELDQIVELKPRTRARRVAAEQSGDRVACTDKAPNPNQLNTEPETKRNVEPSKHFSDNSVSSEGQIASLETVIKRDEKQRRPGFPLESQISPFEHKADKKLGVPLDLPLGELLTDPCIAFAIKTLTGLNFDGLENLEVLLGSNSDHSSVNLTSDLFGAEDHMIDGKQVGQTAASLEEHARNVESKTNSTELPFEASWKDPCIDFAIRTLTDGIPLVYSPNMQQHSQQQLRSPKTQVSDETSLTSVNGLDNSGQANLLRHQFHDSKKPALELLGSSSVGSRSSCQSVLNQHGKEGQ